MYEYTTEVILGEQNKWPVISRQPETMEAYRRELTHCDEVITEENECCEVEVLRPDKGTSVALISEQSVGLRYHYVTCF